MKVVFTNHARERMRERGILESEVIECIRYPAKVLKDGEGIRRFQKLSIHGIIEVVVGVKRNHLVVITVYPL